MKWKLCPLEEGENYINQVLHVTELPEMAVQLSSSFGWETILASLIAGCIPAFISYQAIKNTSKNINKTIDSQNKNLIETINSQENIAASSMKVEVLSKNRQAWINELRETSAKYLTIVTRCSLLVSAYRKNKILHEKYLSEKRRGLILTEDLEDKLKSTFEIVKEQKLEITAAQYEISMAFNKINLLLNPTEKPSIKIIENMNGTINLLGKAISDDVVDPKVIRKTQTLCDQFTSIIQYCLKEEWEKVKEIS